MKCGGGKSPLFLSAETVTSEIEINDTKFDSVPVSVFLDMRPGCGSLLECGVPNRALQFAEPGLGCTYEGCSVRSGDSAATTIICHVVAH